MTKHWSHIILEAHCMRKSSTKGKKYLYELVRDESLRHNESIFKKILNPDYDSTYKTPRKPSYCKDLPNYICLEHECVHLSYCDADKKDYKTLRKRYIK